MFDLLLVGDGREPRSSRPTLNLRIRPGGAFVDSECKAEQRSACLQTTHFFCLLCVSALFLYATLSYARRFHPGHLRDLREHLQRCHSISRRGNATGSSSKLFHTHRFFGASNCCFSVTSLSTFAPRVVYQNSSKSFRLR